MITFGKWYLAILTISYLLLNNLSSAKQPPEELVKGYLFSSYLQNGDKRIEVAIVDEKVLAIEKKKSKYDYRLLDNGTYKLENNFEFTVKDGLLNKVINDGDEYFNDSNFFNNISDQCKIFKVDVALRLFVIQKMNVVVQYQLASRYPQPIKVVIFNNKEGNYDNLRAFYITQFRDIGCLPYNKLYKIPLIEYFNYPNHLDGYDIIDGIDNLKGNQAGLQREISTVLEVKDGNVIIFKGIDDAKNYKENLKKEEEKRRKKQLRDEQEKQKLKEAEDKAKQ